MGSRDRRFSSPARSWESLMPTDIWSVPMASRESSFRPLATPSSTPQVGHTLLVSILLMAVRSISISPSIPGRRRTSLLPSLFPPRVGRSGLSMRAQRSELRLRPAPSSILSARSAMILRPERPRAIRARMRRTRISALRRTLLLRDRMLLRPSVGHILT